MSTTTSTKKPFTIYGHQGGPNPPKVLFVMNELGLEYEYIPLDMQKGEMKAPAYLKINPNGRVPALIDHSNNDFTIWESGAIIQYVVAKYDKQNKLHTGNFESDMIAAQWLFFQVSGQGPYFGQAAWFSMFHHEKLPSAIERYFKEASRVFSVLETALEGKDYLVDNRLTYADISFISWNNGAISGFTGVKEDYAEGKYPNVKKWHERLMALESVKKGIEQTKRA